MAVLLLANIDLEEWFGQLRAELMKRKPDLDLRVWPECGNPEEIEIVLAWWPPLGVMQKFPNLKLIMSLGASVDRILIDPDLPDRIPIVRLVSEGKILEMTEYVTLAVLLFQRRFIEYQVAMRSGELGISTGTRGEGLYRGNFGVGSIRICGGQKASSYGIYPAGMESRTQSNCRSRML